RSRTLSRIYRCQTHRRLPPVRHRKSSVGSQNGCLPRGPERQQRQRNSVSVRRGKIDGRDQRRFQNRAAFVSAPGTSLRRGHSLVTRPSASLPEKLPVAARRRKSASCSRPPAASGGGVPQGLATGTRGEISEGCPLRTICPCSRRPIKKYEELRWCRSGVRSDG